MAPARAIAVHVSGRCDGACLGALGDIESAALAGAAGTALMGQLKVGPLMLAHGGRGQNRRAWKTLSAIIECGLGPRLRHWTRLYVPYARSALTLPNGATLLCRLAAIDPDGWRDALVEVLRHAMGSDRVLLVRAVIQHANRTTVGQLRALAGDDVAEARRTLQHHQAARLFLRTFGTVSLHRGDWTGRELPTGKKRVRALLGVLVSRANTSLSRDMVVDILWPDADADSAINNLNQTVFQLRRCIDPGYRGGESPEYLVSTAEQVFLNPDLVRTDLDELRSLPARLQGSDWNQRQSVARRAIDLVRGEFLADLRYEDWTAARQLAIHREVRDSLLPIAIATSGTFDADVSERAASALVALDPFDEPAILALATCLTQTGRKVAARNLLIDYVQRLRVEINEDPSVDFLNAAAGLRSQLRQ